MTDRNFAEAQRLAFGSVAEIYDRARPSYPRAVIDAVIESAKLALPARIFEVGAGTGIATALFAERGFDVLALEPDREMARIARAKFAAFTNVKIIESDLESWEPHERRAALISAQAWHWTSPDVRYQRAHQALMHRGTLAAIWTFPDWGRCQLRSALSDAYRVAAPDMTTDFPMHPDSNPTALAGDWCSEIAASGLFADPLVRTYGWSEHYNTSDYTRLLQTHQDHILMQPERRAALLTAVANTIDRAGGNIAMPFVTHLCAATRC